MACSRLRKAECQVSPNCDWVVSKGCKSKVPRATSNNLKREIEELSIKIDNFIHIYEKTDGARRINNLVPYHQPTDEVDYLTGKDLQMIMTGKVKSIQVGSQDLSSGFELINITKKYLTDKQNLADRDVDNGYTIDLREFLLPEKTNVPVHNEYTHFVKITQKTVTFLKKQLSRIQEEFEGTRNKQQGTSNKQQATSNKQQATSSKQQATSNKQQGTSSNNNSLPNIEKVKQAYKNLFKKNPPNPMGIHRMLHDIVNLLQLNNNSWRVLFN
jgi:hypothetical protein